MVFRVRVGVENCEPSGFLTSQVVIYFAIGINDVIHIYGRLKAHRLLYKLKFYRVSS
jgi:hypothetical protein